MAVGGCLVCLAALLQPSLEATHDQAKQSHCLERLRSIMAASQTYAQNDPQDWAIPVHPLQFNQNPTNPSFIGAYEWGGKSGIGRDYWVTGAPGDPLNSKYGTRAGFGPATRPLNDILYPHGFRDTLNPVFNPAGATLDTQLDLAVYRCPGDDGPPDGGHCPDWLNHPGQSSYDHFGTSYAANIFMISTQGGGYMRSNSPYLRPLARVPNPARTIFYEENIGRWAWAAREDWCDFLLGIDIGPTRVIRGWHGKDWCYNQAFGDGHARMNRIYIDRTEDAEGYAWHYLSEVVFPDDSNQQQSMRCVIIRGPGWQKDTLPAEDINTGLWSCGEGRASYEDCVHE